MSKRKVGRSQPDKLKTLTLSAFVPRAYGELRQIAARYFKSERPGRTLQPTALVHEAFIRLAENGPRAYANRAHFFAVAAKTMRRILIEQARRRGAQKRGGGWERISLDEVRLPYPEAPNYLAIDSALTQLSRFDERLGQIAELRIFAGLTARETADLLEAGESTIRDKWHVAEAWLKREIQKQADR